MVERDTRIFGTTDPATQDDLIRANIAVTRQMVAAMERMEKANGGGGGGWLSRHITERVIALLIAGFIALAGWVGVQNVRYAVLKTRIDGIHLPSPELVNRMDRLEAQLDRHISAER